MLGDTGDEKGTGIADLVAMAGGLFYFEKNEGGSGR